MKIKRLSYADTEMLVKDSHNDVQMNGGLSLIEGI